jgi:septal ring factor EnvC (AmiA/AmiB activator)
MKLLKAVLVFILASIASIAFAQSQPNSSAELKRQREKLNEQLNELNHQYEQTANNKKSTLKQLTLIKTQINLRIQKIETINTEVRLLDNQISQNNNSVHNLQSQLAQLKKEYAAMILFAYRNQSAYNKMMFVFASHDFNQAYKRLKYMQQFGAYRERQAAYIEGTENDLHVKIVELDQNKKEKSTLLQDQEKEKENLGKEKNNQAKIVEDLSKQQSQLKEQQREVQNRIAKIDREIRAAVRREIEEQRKRAEEAARLAAEKAKAENREVVVTKKTITKKSTDSEVLNATPEAARLSNDFLGNRGRLPWPVANGEVIQDFGVYYTEGIKNDNSGIDIKTNSGANVRAVFEGKVVNVINVYGSYTVMIIHGEYFTVYSNLRSVSVSKGEKVGTKQSIGTVANDSSTGIPEIHFEIYRAKEVVNPRTWLAPN